MTTCEYCGYIPKNGKYLKHHQETVKYCLAIQGKTNEEFKCKFCSKNFTRNTTLVTHMEKCFDKQEIQRLREETMELKIKMAEMTRTTINDENVPEFKDWIYDDNYRVYKDSKIYSKCSGRFLTPSERNGYHVVYLKPIDGKRQVYLIHRMVAIMFCENPEEKPIVDHIDRNPKNNHYSNLRWVTYSENNHNKEHVVTVRKVQQWSEDEETLIREYNSVKQASEATGIKTGTISQACTNSLKISGKDGLYYIWKHTEKYPVLELPNSAKEIPGFPNYYVTSDAKIYSNKTKRFLKTRTSSDGYVIVSLRTSGIIKRLNVHRCVADVFIEDKPENYQELHVNHKDGNKQNNNVDNLEYLTCSENALHSSRVLGRKTCTQVEILDENNNILKFSNYKHASEFLGIKGHSFFGEKYKKFMNENPGKIPDIFVFKSRFKKSS